MKSLVLVFLLMALYGVATMHLGGAVLALAMAGLVYYARGHFARADAHWEAMPRQAKTPGPTEHELDRHECECMRDKT